MREPLVVLGVLVEMVVVGCAQLGPELHRVHASISLDSTALHLGPVNGHAVIELPRHRPIVRLDNRLGDQIYRVRADL